MDPTSYKTMRQILMLLRCRSSTITHLHVYGTSASSKEAVMQGVIDEIEEKGEGMVLRVNCHLNDGSQKLFCRELYNLLPHASSGKKIETLEAVFEEFGAELSLTKSNIMLVLVLNHAELLLNFPQNFLQALFSLPKQHNGLIKLITVSRLPWERFELTEHVSTPTQFAFEALSKVNVQQALSERLNNYDSSFVKSMLDTVYAVCNDLDQLCKLIEKLWDTRGNDRKTASNKNKVNFKGDKCANDALLRNEGPKVFENDCQTFSMPTSSKFLLVAAYCASYNPAGSDRRFFTKNHGKHRRRGGLTKFDKSSESAHEIGPKAFPLQRLLFIYLALLELYNMRSLCVTDINVQVSDLCSMGFLNRVSTDGNLDAPKFRCIVTFEFAERLAKMVDIKLKDYLVDFASNNV